MGLVKILNKILIGILYLFEVGYQITKGIIPGLMLLLIYSILWGGQGFNWLIFLVWISAVGGVFVETQLDKIFKVLLRLE